MSREERVRRVIEVIASGAIGGGATHLRSLVEGIERSAFHPIVVCSPDGPLLPELSLSGVQTEGVALAGRFNLAALLRLTGVIRKSGAELIHAHGTRAGLVSAMAASSLNLPFVYTVHGWSFHPRGHRCLERGAEMVERQICSLADRVICVSRADLKEGLVRGVLREETSLVVHNGVDLKAYGGESREREACRRDFGIGEDELLVSLFGRLTPQKGQRFLLRAAHDLSERFPNLRFMLVGEGEDREVLEGMVRELGIERFVLFAGGRRDVGRLFDATDLCTLPSLWEGLPLCLLEAMAARKPVVASDVNGNREVVQHGLTGFLVPSQDPVALASYLGWLISDPLLRLRFGLAGRARVEKNFQVERMLRKTEEVYRGLLKESG